MADTEVGGCGVPVPPASGAELSSTDVDPDWFTENTGEEPAPSRPLSASSLQVFVGVPAGSRSADVAVPTVSDALTEPAERLRLQLMTWPDFDEDPVPGPEMTGTVTDRP